MTLYKEWHDFTMYPDWEKVSSEAQRLDTSQAIRFKPNTPSELLRYNEEEVERRGILNLEEDFAYSGDKFVAMQINPRGHVTLWTTKYVYELVRDLGVEKMHRSPRNPPNHTAIVDIKSMMAKFMSIAGASKRV